MTPAETLARASQAQRLLDDPLMKEALELIEREVIEQWEACPARDKDAREFLWMYYKNVRKFKAILQGAIESGKLAAHELKQKESLMQQTVRRFKR